MSPSTPAVIIVQIKYSYLNDGSTWIRHVIGSRPAWILQNNQQAADRNQSLFLKGWFDCVVFSYEPLNDSGVFN